MRRYEERIHELVDRFKPFNMHVNMDLIERAARSLVLAKSDDTKAMFQRTLDGFQNRVDLLRLKINKPFVEVPKFEVGFISPGAFMQAGNIYHDCRLSSLDRLSMTSIYGGVGKGKTNLLFQIAREVHNYSVPLETEKKIGIIILDRVKKDFRNLDIPAVVLDVKDLRINFFDPPPGVPKEKWIPEMCDALMHIWGWLYASRNYFSTKINNLLQNGDIPTFHEIYHTIKNDKESYGAKTRRLSETQEINLDRLDATSRAFDVCLSTRKTFQLHEIINQRINLVIEADLTPDAFSILLSWLLLYIYMHNKYNDIRGNISNGGTLLIFDEAYIIWDMVKAYSTGRKELGQDFISLAPLYLRDFRCALVVASQRPLSPDFQASVSLNLIGYSGDPKDCRMYANFLGKEDLAEEIMKLDRGEFFIKDGDKPAALIKVPLVPFKKDHRITDDEIGLEMEEYRQMIIEYCKEEKPRQEEKEYSDISETTKAFLIDILAYPDSQLKDRYDRLHLKDSTQQDALIAVLRSGCISLVKDTLHSKKQSKYLVASQNGISWLRSQEKDCSEIENQGAMTPAHSLYQTTLLLRLRGMGLQAWKEGIVGQKKIDVVSGRLGLEIAVNNDVDVSRVVSALPFLDDYYFLCQSAIVEHSIKSRLPNDEKIKFRIASNFLLSLLDSESDDFRSIYKYHQTIPNNPNLQESNSDSHDQPESRRPD